MYAYYQVINRNETLQNFVVKSSVTGLLEIPLYTPRRHDDYDDDTLSGVVVEGLGVAQVSGIVAALMGSEGSSSCSQQTLSQMNPICTLTLTWFKVWFYIILSCKPSCRHWCFSNPITAHFLFPFCVFHIRSSYSP